MIGVSRDAAPAGAMRRIRRRAGEINLGPVEWLAAEGQIDPTFIELLPGRVEALEAGEAEELARIFDEGGAASGAVLLIGCP